jgi:SAM-dependent methyltransferase
MSEQGRCRFCGATLKTTFVDLGMSPLSNSYPDSSQIREMERFFPLHVWLCDDCLLVQLEQFETPEAIFSDYAYFSSYSDSWLRHARSYADEMIPRFSLGPQSQIMEVGSNDGYLLRFFLERGIPSLGIEPAANVAAKAQEKGVPTLVRFFGRALAEELALKGHWADLLAANNVVAHVPDLNDFVAGLRTILKPEGVATVEFPHLRRLIEGNQYDTIYHEHFSYFSLLVVEKVFAKHGLVAFDVEELPTHGGSLRVFAQRREARRPISSALARIRRAETEFGLNRRETYLTFASHVAESRLAILDFLIQARRNGRRVVGYGAPAKGNTLLNYCSIRTDLLPFTVDRSPYKQGRFLPGVHIPITEVDKISEYRPDFLVILPWNLRDEIIEQMAVIRSWGGRFVIFIPRVQVLP